MYKFFKFCTPDNFAIKQHQIQKLAVLSRCRMQEVTDSLQLEHEQGEGLMVILRSEKDAFSIKSKLDFMRSENIAYQEISTETARKLELALNPDTQFHRAIQFPTGGVGNCRQFALLLKKEAQRLGVNFVFNASVQDIDTSNGFKLKIANDTNLHSFDAVLVCAGIASAELLRRKGLKIPLTSVYGYSISANVRELLNAPRSAIFDQRFMISISRQGNRIRVSGGGEIGGYPDKKHEKTLKILYKVLQDWFPGAANLSHGVQVWKGARATLPDGLPLIGESGIPGLWLNLGHGSAGWALSSGSAKIVSEMMSGHTTGIDIEGFGMKRFIC
jgi:D-amino-acid dehydrogenase